MYIENNQRSLLKTISWRILSTLVTSLIVFVFTGNVLLAVSVGGVEALAKIVLYFFHERLWNRISFGKKRIQPFVLWFTGLSGSGKSSLADKAYEYLKCKGYSVERLDGDNIRTLFPKTGFSKEERDQHIRRIGLLASTLEKNGIFVVASFVSPYKESRQFVKKLCKNFKEIYVRASVEICESRDTKGLYKKARSGELQKFTGISDPYEEPEFPEICIDTNQQALEESFSELKKHIDKFIKELA